MLAAISAGALMGPGVVHAGPVGGQVTAGAATVSQSGATTNVNQSTANVSINWQSFNVGAQETVNFAQPTASSIAVNRIADTNGSTIFGKLNANGQVFLINPNGVLFGAGSQVNVGGLVASTLDVSDSALNSASRTFSGAGKGSVVNQGTITAADGGYVALLGNTVSNQGVIGARLGTVALGGASAATLTFSGNSLLSMKVDQSTLDTLAENKQLIQANGGTVLMSAGAKDTLLASVVNNTGVIEARTVENKNGVVTLLAGMEAGTTVVGGTIDASAPTGGDGGYVDTSAANVQFIEGRKVTTASATGKTGTWLIDPTNIIVGGAGATTTGAQVGTDLGLNNVVLTNPAGGAEAGVIQINDAITWATNNSLTLNAVSNITISNNITATSTGTGGSLIANAGSGGTGSVTVNGGTISMAGTNSIVTLNSTANSAVNVSAPISLTGANAALNIAGGSGSVNVTGTLTNSGAAATTTITHPGGQLNITGANGRLDMAATSALNIAGNPYAWVSTLGAQGSVDTTTLQGLNAITTGFYALRQNIDATATAGFNGGLGFDPIAAQNVGFAGTFEGLGHTISNLTVNRPAATYNGLFADIASGGRVQNVTMTGAAITSGNVAGVLAGRNNTGGVIRNVTVSGSTVNGAIATGGLVGLNEASIFGSQAGATVIATNESTGGLVGENGVGGTIQQSSSSGSVTSALGQVGGLVGRNEGAVLTGNSSSSNASSTQDASLITPGASDDVGGLVGLNLLGASIAGGTASGTVTGITGIGGFVGGNNGTVTGGSSSGVVSGITNTGGFVGVQTGGSISGASSSSNVNNANSGTPRAATRTGGFIGYNTVGLGGVNPISSITTSSSSGTVNGVTTVGGFAGENSGNISTSFHITGAVVATGDQVGGFVGLNQGGTIATSYATSNVTGNNSVGGFAGSNAAGGQGGSIDQTFALGNVTGNTFVGGHTGSLFGNSGATRPSSISNSYAAVGTVTGASNAGGLVGLAEQALTGNDGVTITNSYAAGPVAGSGGGAIGNPGTAVTTSTYWNTASTGQATSAQGGGTAAGTAPVDAVTGLQQASYGGFDFTAGTGLWKIYEGLTAPLLTFNLTPLTITTAATPNATYAGTPMTDAQRGVTYSINGFNAANAVAEGRLSEAPYTNAVAVGTYNAANSIYSNQLGTNQALGGYNVTYNGTNQLVIAPATVTAALAGTITKPYDQSDSAVLAAGNYVLTGVAAGESFTVNQTVGTYGSTQAGPTTVTAALATGNFVPVGGTLASNYILPTTAAGTGTITPLTITAAVASSTKVYDGLLSTTAVLGATGILTGDTVDLAGTAALTNKDVGTAKTVNVTGIAATGAQSTNYVLSATTATANNAEVTPKTITVAAAAANKVYDSLTTATTTVTSADIVAGDVVTLAGTGTFADKNVGVSKVVTVNGIAAGGAQAGNYTLATTTATAAADITPLAITATQTAANKVYDGNTIATTTATSTGVLAGDVVNFAGSGAFDTKNVGTGKTVTLGAVVAGGADAGNYTVTGANATTTADVTPKSLTAAVTAADKTYDGTTAATVTAASADVVAGDVVTFASSGTFADKNAAVGKTVTLGALTVGGADATNYTVIGSNPTTTATINPLAISATATAANKVYDGTTAATTTATSTGVLAGDTVTFAGTGTFDNKNAGNGKTVTIGAITTGGADAGNYVATTANATATANISQKAITTAVAAANKVYDGTTAATATVSAAGLVAGDAVTFTGNGSFDTKNVGNGKTVTLGPVTVGGADAANYVITPGTVSTTANITPKSITTAATAANKVYDGTTTAAATVTGTGVVAGDAVTFTGTGNFADKNVGNGKTVTVAVGTAGADAGNYSLAAALATTTASITPAPLVYVAAPATSPAGVTPSGLTGTVTGFVAGETIANATTGTLAWTTPATAVSPAGSYAINGGGLVAQNYALSQAPSSATALTITPAGGLTPAQADLIRRMAASAQALGATERVALIEPGTNDVSSGILRNSPAKFNPLDFVVVRPDERKDTLSRVAVNGGMRLPADRLIPPGGEAANAPASNNTSAK